MNSFKKKKGITLIALVITIIVMLILVAVTINMAVNGGLFDYARRAAVDTNTRIEEEKDLANIATGQDYEQLIAKYTTSENSGVTNPYASETPAHTWACDTSGKWSNATGSETSGILAKLYMKGTVINSKGLEVDGYHLVIEPVGANGTMGDVFIQPTNNGGSGMASAGLVAWQATGGPRDLINKVIICDGITNICVYAFDSCGNLKNVTLPKSLENIGDYAFNGCNLLASINYNGTMTEWNAITKGLDWQGTVTTVHCSDGDVSV